MCWKIAVTILSLFGLSGARSSGLYSEESPSSIRLEQCHDGCIKKVRDFFQLFCQSMGCPFNLAQSCRK